MSKIVYKCKIMGAARTKKNHSRIITNPKTGKPMVIQSKQYVQYEADALKQLHKPAEPISTAVNAQYRYYMPNARKCDLVNLIQATNDILVKGEVIADDNYTIVASHDGSGVWVDKENPRVEIAITEIERNVK